MRDVILFLFAFSALRAFGQHECVSYHYFQQEIQQNLSLVKKGEEIESFVRRRLLANTVRMSPAGQAGSTLSVIRIPVIVHILYNNDEQKISEKQVLSQMEALNRDFRKRNAELADIPDYFKPLAADCFIEFVLASVDPQGKPTRGIIWKKTNVSAFGVDDRIKFSELGGDDAWDSEKYLNIWVGKLSPGAVGYASTPGATKEKDGIVIRYTAFGTLGTVVAPYHLGRITVHETGHWLGLKHIWGDQYCGDDQVDDTPAQKGPTKGCPTGIAPSCDNFVAGSMYMNYMDVTYDACTKLFTAGQRERMRALFADGGPRHAILFSQGGSGSAFPIAAEIPIDTASTQQGSIFPNPARNQVTVHAGEEIGETIIIYNHLGQQLFNRKVVSANMKLDVSMLRSGVYFVGIGKSKTVKFMKL